MRKMIFTFCFASLALAFASQTFAQDAPKPQETATATASQARYYHLEFVVQELGTDGKAVNSRTYTTTTSTDAHDNSSIRTNSRIPIVTSSYSTGQEPSSALVNTQIQYQNVGVDIDVHRMREVGRQLSFDLTADVSSVAESRDPKVHQPVIRQNRWQSAVLIPIGKPTVVFTSDALDSKGSMQLVVTASAVR